MKTLFVFLLGFFLINGSLQAQSVKLKAILDATEKYKTQEEFTEYLKQFDFCLDPKRGRSTFTFYPHFKCGTTEIGEKGLRVNFSISKDGSLNSSFSTKNKKFVRGYKKELKKYDFVEISLPAIVKNQEKMHCGMLLKNIQNCIFYGNILLMTTKIKFGILVLYGIYLITNNH